MYTRLYSQGCSDAGFCSLGVLKNNIPVADNNYAFTMGTSYGLGEENTNIFNSYLEYAVYGNSQLSCQVKITTAYTSGFLGSTFNMADLFASINYVNKTGASNRLSLLSGIKIPLSHSNDKNEDGKPLPMDYQSSLGTYDIIAGTSYNMEAKWELNAGVQIPVVQKNKNTFFPDEYDDPRVNSFPATNNFRRKSDVLARIGYYHALKNASLTLKPNILAIYHTGEDSYEDRLGKREKIEGSNGLTVNAGIIAVKAFGNGSDLELIVAAPFIVRDVRPDGLTRGIVINLQYRFGF